MWPALDPSLSNCGRTPVQLRSDSRIAVAVAYRLANHRKALSQEADAVRTREGFFHHRIAREFTSDHGQSLIRVSQLCRMIRENSYAATPVAPKTAIFVPALTSLALGRRTGAPMLAAKSHAIQGGCGQNQSSFLRKRTTASPTAATETTSEDMTGQNGKFAWAPLANCAARPDKPAGE